MAREVRDFGQRPASGKVARFEFDRDDLESLLHVFSPGDGFTRDVREAMKWMDDDCPYLTRDECWDEQEARATAAFVCPVHGQAQDTLERLGVDVL